MTDMIARAMTLASALMAATAAWAPLEAAAETGSTRWGYDKAVGPTAWSKLSPDFAACGAGRQQSPIDLGVADELGGEPSVVIDYKPLPLTILHNGYTVEVAVDNGSRMILEGKEYRLLQFHFHTPSEHSVDGKRFDVEMHFVHRSADGQLAVIGVLIEGGSENSALAEVMAHAPLEKTSAQTYTDALIDPGALLPPLTAFWSYDGSLTTPPCTEGVRWMIERARAPMSQQHIDILSKAMGDNARPIQPINDRHIIAPQ